MVGAQVRTALDAPSTGLEVTAEFAVRIDANRVRPLGAAPFAVRGAVVAADSEVCLGAHAATAGAGTVAGIGMPVAAETT